MKRHYKKLKLQVNTFEEYRCKNPQQNISKLKPINIKRTIYCDQVGFNPGTKNDLPFANQSI